MKYIVLAVLIWSAASCSDEDQFPRQVEKLVRRVRMPEARLRAVPGLLHKLQTILNKRWPGCKVNLLGSMAYGLAMSYSDMDLTIDLPDHKDTSFESLNAVALEAKELLQQHPDFVNFIYWTNLTVPVVTFDDAPTEFEIDVSFNTHNERQRSQTIKYIMRLDKRAYYLAFIAKYWSRLSNTEEEEPLLRNHGMFLLVIFYLQQKNALPPISSLQENATAYMIDEWNFGFDKINYDTQNNHSLSSIIGGFFTYYSEFDFDSYIVSTYAGYPIPKSAFERLDTVPAVFELYKNNVKSGRSKPIRISRGMMVQDMFVHNQCINNTLDTQPGSPFRIIFKDAAKRFQEDKAEFLKILRRSTFTG